MREASVTEGGFGAVALKAALSMSSGAALADGAIEVLHAQQVRGDERVPPSVR